MAYLLCIIFKLQHTAWLVCGVQCVAVAYLLHLHSVSFFYSLGDI